MDRDLFRPEISESEGTFHLRRGAWMNRAEVHEHLRLGPAGNPLMEVGLDLELVPAEPVLSAMHQPPFDSALAAIDDDSPSSGGFGAVRLHSELLDEDLAGALSRMQAALGAGVSAQLRATDALAAFLRAHPEHTEVLLTKMRAGEVEAELHALIFAAISRSSIPEAQTGLAEAMNDGRFSTADRLRAVVGSADSSDLSDESFDTLLDASRLPLDTGDDVDQDIASTTTLGLGIAASRDPARRDAIASELGARMDEANPSALITLIGAAGNSHHPTLGRRLVSLTSHDAPRVRPRAAEALEIDAPEGSVDALTTRLETETDEAVRAQVARSLTQLLDHGARGERHDPFAAAMRILPNGPSVGVRQALVGLIGLRAEAPGLARDALVQQFRVETERLILVEIGRYVSAEFLVR